MSDRAENIPDRGQGAPVSRHSCSVEILFHFSCSACHRWWSIGDATPDKERWFCPWCGTEQRFSLIKK